MTKALSHPLVKLGGSIILLYLIFLRTDLTVIKNSLIHVASGLLLTALLINITAEILCIERHWLIIRSLGGRGNRWDMAKTYFKSVLAALFIPGGTELAKWVILRKNFRENQTKKSGISILIDRGLGIIGLLLALIIGLIPASKMIGLRLTVIALLSALAGIFTIVIVLSKIASSYNFQRKAKTFFLGICYSTIYQILVGIITILIIGALDGFSYNYLSVFFIMPIVSFISMIPITVGGLGLRELSLASFSTLVGIAPEVLVVSSLFIWGFLVIESLIGWYFVLTHKRSTNGYISNETV